jgi:putative phage-type endonuclease
MQIHDLTQGTPEWLAYRAQHFNASDAPAMMGVSPYKTRNALLHELHTGLAKEVSDTVQALFDGGHRFEALSRTLAEQIVGEPLYPVTGSEGRLSASFDGLTMAEDAVWEHKMLNDDIRAAQAIADLRIDYRIQMEQQLLVSSAEKALFLATRWSADGELLEQKQFWYTSDAALRTDIEAGWEQFEKDLAAYEPKQIAEKPAAAPILSLPTLVVQTKGEVVQSNLPDFKVAAEQFLANIKMELATDEDFANAEATVKFCGEAEKKLELTKSAVLAQAATIDDVMRAIDNISDQLRSKRLALDKLVAKRKTEIKETILSTAKLAHAEHVAALEAEIKPLRLPATVPDFAGAMKNKRTLASLNEAVDTLLAGAKIASNTVAAGYRAKQAWCKENATGFGFLFMDMATIIDKPMDDFQLLVNSRIAEHKRVEAARAEALRAEIAAEEQAKAEAAGAAKAAAAEAERLANERAAAALAEQNRLAADTAERQRAANAAAANVAADAAASIAVPAGAAPEIARTAAFYNEPRAAAPARAAQLQTLAEQHLADGAATAKVGRAAGLPAGALRQAAAPAHLFDASTGPSDQDIIDFGAQFDMDLDELLPRLEQFIAEMRANHAAVAA